MTRGPKHGVRRFTWGGQKMRSPALRCPHVCGHTCVSLTGPHLLIQLYCPTPRSDFPDLSPRPDSEPETSSVHRLKSVPQKDTPLRSPGVSPGFSRPVCRFRPLGPVTCGMWPLPSTSAHCGSKISPEPKNPSVGRASRPPSPRSLPTRAQDCFLRLFAADFSPSRRRDR